MPYNILLLPLLAGYLFLSRSRFRSYATARLPKDQLLLAAAVSGFFFLIVSRTVCYWLLQTSVGLAFATWLHKVAPFDFIGTALGTLILAGTLIKISNMLVSEQVAGFWLYHRGDMDPLMGILWSSYVGVEPSNAPGALRLSLTIVKEMLLFFCRQFQFKALFGALWNIRETIALIRSRELAFSKLKRGPLRSVMVNLKDGKVIVGYVTDMLTTKPSVEFVTIAPVWTGYRDSSSRVLKTVDYSATVAEAKASSGGSSDLEDIRAFSRVIRIADIASASVFNAGAFKIRESEAHFGEAGTAPAEVPAPLGFWDRLVFLFRGRR
ncbi:hypothetical protein A7X84_09985 [Stenotrophomonas maltophilia]|uniref:hypothetical protein n=1 Tax=Stenotrophomonas maltophilia TaxID=40324 RepID=UPI000DA954B0|nr:hypothetical protein [Stenotrophomonas maltophilia]PZS82926.1 hypothetical protein A7X84_09985 [Stenotrophomonas maltophilia]PZT11786.1 hypothetical protein A7X82_17685 [Stenotrophomonas maltophilia]